MTVTDAANLLIAIAGTSVTREAGSAIKTFRKLRNGRCYFFQKGHARFLIKGIEFLADGVGVDGEHSERGGPVAIQGEFGEFFELIIKSTLDGKLAELFSHIPTAEIPDELWRKWRAKGGDLANCYKSMDELIKEGLVFPYPVQELEFGEHISLEIKFSRLVPAVEIEFVRVWDQPETVASITFGPERGGKARGQHRLQLEAGFTQHTLAAVALVIGNRVRPSSIHTLKAVDGLFADQFQNHAAWGRVA